MEVGVLGFKGEFDCMFVDSFDLLDIVYCFYVGVFDFFVVYCIECCFYVGGGYWIFVVECCFM